RADPATTWAEVRSDPGCVLLVVRQAGACLASPALSFFPSLLHDSSILVGALRHLEQPHPPCVDWNHPLVLPTYQACLDYARLAFRIAEQTGKADPENAWVAGLLAPLGWLTVCAIEPGLAKEVRSQITEFKLPI